MKQFQTKAIINAPVRVVWETLTNAQAYPKFDPNCRKVEGNIEQGKYILLHSKLHRKVFRIRVREMRPTETMVWELGLPLNLFKGVRTYTITAKDDQTTEFQMVEIFGGHCSHFFLKMIPDMNEAFSQFSKGLKRFIEARP